MPRPRSLKKWLWLGILLLAAVVLLLLTRRGLRPFRDLEAADLIAVSVELLPPDVTVTLDAAEQEELAVLITVTSLIWAIFLVTFLAISLEAAEVTGAVAEAMDR